MSAGALTNDPHGASAIIHAGPPLQQAEGAIVLLHGRGASAQDILQLGAAFAPKGWAMLAPEAAGHTWYPYSFLVPRSQNEPWLSSALKRVDSILRELRENGFAEDRVVLAGFSQGACLTAEYASARPRRYGAVLAFTGGMIGPSLDPGPLPGSLDGTHALFASGDPDPHVPWTRVQETAEKFATAGAEVALRRYPKRPHTVGREEVLLAREMLERISASDH